MIYFSTWSVIAILIAIVMHAYEHCIIRRGESCEAYGLRVWFCTFLWPIALVWYTINLVLWPFAALLTWWKADRIESEQIRTFARELRDVALPEKEFRALRDRLKLEEIKPERLI